MERARDLFYALWVPDLFMKRVEAGLAHEFQSRHGFPGDAMTCVINLSDVHNPF